MTCYYGLITCGWLFYDILDGFITVCDLTSDVELRILIVDVLALNPSWNHLVIMGGIYKTALPSSGQEDKAANFLFWPQDE
jgi:hypothetical protein